MKTRYRFLLIVFAFLGLFLNSCIAPQSQNKEISTGIPDRSENAQPEPTNVWSSLLVVTPVPYTSPLAPTEVTSLDGTYAKYDPAPPQWWSCLRCADYRPAGGAWRLQFDRGVMRIYYEVTGWNSLASYTVSGDRLYLYNDPYCKEATGEYKWSLTDKNLTLEAIDDPCSFQLRGKNLGGQAWEACQGEDSAVSEQPRGCSDPVVEESQSIPALSNGLNVSVYEADVRLTPPSPDVYAHASGENQSLPEGVRISYSDESLLYGTNRVLWVDDDWVEVVTAAPFTSIGVQFRGDYVIGWARVLFDGQEVWRGDTSRIWSDLKIHGGYIEVSGFDVGEHTLRVERLEVDSRPVVVAFFGFKR